MKFRIYFEDTDAQGIVYHSNYIKFCERARSEALIKANLKLDNSKYIVVSKLEAKFIRPAKYGDIIDIKTEIFDIKKATATFVQKIYKIENINGDKCNELLFEMNVTIAYLQNAKPIRFDDELIEFFQKHLN